MEGIHRFAGLEGQVRVLAGAAQLRMVGRQSAGAVSRDQLLRHQGLQGGVVDQLHPLDLVGGAEPVEDVQQRHPGRQAGGRGDGSKVAGFLHAGGEQQPAAGAAGGHHIAVVAEDRQGRGGQGPRGHVDHRRRQLAGDLVEVGDHQQQPLRRGERRRQGAGLQGAVHHAGGAGFALHLHHRRHAAPEVGAPLAGPGIRPFPHGRGRRDRVDRHHLVEAVGDPRHGLVAVDPGHGAHGPASLSSASSTVRAMPTCTSS